MELKEVFALAFMKRAILGGIIVGVIASISGLFVVLRRMSFLGTGVAHSVLGGIAIGFLFSISPSITAIIVGILTGFLISLSTKKLKITEDSSIGIFFPLMMAVGIIILSFIKGYTPNLLSYLFGDILLVNWNDILLGGISLLIVIIFILTFYKELLLITFDEESSKILGVNVELIDYMFLSLVALSIVVSIKIVGIILVSSMIVVPAVSALKLSNSFGSAIFLSLFFGVFSSVGGIIASYFLDIPSGPTIVVFSFILLLISLLIKAFTKK